MSKNKVKAVEVKQEAVKQEVKTEPTQATITTEVKSFELDRNIKCGGKYYQKGHKFNEFDANFSTFKNFTLI